MVIVFIKKTDGMEDRVYCFSFLNEWQNST